MWDICQGELRAPDGASPRAVFCRQQNWRGGAFDTKNRTTGFGLCPVEFGLALSQYFLIMLISLGNSKTMITISELNWKQALLNTGQNYGYQTGLQPSFLEYVASNWISLELIKAKATGCFPSLSNQEQAHILTYFLPTLPVMYV